MTLLHEAEIKTTRPMNVIAQHRPHGHVEIDTEHYQALLDGSDLNAKQRTDFLAALWSVIVAFTDLGYGVHPLQHALPGLTIGEDLNREIIRTIEEFWRDAA
ncbi:hypothetical protein KM031_12385 [Gemmobacter fulvus]|uniref:Uncharacterized protein n=1 Tax=Gemmobacter fulvus TaxID=2840474 RepID=A0A975P4D5_9RHOB|nr:hypothetical protein [Gemmobacter fulvus]MBT9247857.1 hypothetical protein [Gemmobacter fulvus]QWK89635.1 hypothetical protein KM031_12385 [Gemmobacter fulvus]